MKQKIDNAIDEYLKKEISYLDDDFLKYCYSLVQKYSQGGKRLRPIALMLSFESYNGKGNILPIALAIEMYHTHTLIIDDIIDEDEFRRNNPTVYKYFQEYYVKYFPESLYKKSLFSSKSNRFSVSMALMLGNITNALARKLILSSDFLDNLKTNALLKLEKANQEIYHGQILDLQMENNNSTEKQYLEMIYKKTAVLFGLCLELGSLFAGKDEHTQHIMKNIGEKIALGFQIQDDLLDITGKKGHEQGSDIKKNKKTLLMIKLLEKTQVKTNNINEIIKMMYDYHIVDYCNKKIHEITNEAKSMITKLDIQLHHKEQLLRLSDLFNNPV